MSSLPPALQALAAKLAEREAQVERLLAMQMEHEIALEAAEARAAELTAEKERLLAALTWVAENPWAHHANRLEVVRAALKGDKP